MSFFNIQWTVDNAFRASQPATLFRFIVDQICKSALACPYLHMAKGEKVRATHNFIADV